MLHLERSLSCSEQVMFTHITSCSWLMVQIIMYFTDYCTWHRLLLLGVWYSCFCSQNSFILALF